MCSLDISAPSPGVRIVLATFVLLITPILSNCRLAPWAFLLTSTISSPNVAYEIQHLRPTAYELAEMFPPHKHNAQLSPTALNHLLQKYACPQTFYIWCIECGTLMTDMYYHCDICYQANFDLCQLCAAQDIHCFDPQHTLTKRIVTKDGVIQNAPD